MCTFDCMKQPLLRGNKIPATVKHTKSWHSHGAFLADRLRPSAATIKSSAPDSLTHTWTDTEHC